MSEYKPFFSRNYTCPICKTDFSSFSIRSSSIYVQRREPDLHTIYKGISPLHYSIVVCPTCNYAGSTKSFPREIPLPITEQIGQALFTLKADDNTCFSEERDLDTALKSFQLAIRSAQLKQVPAGEIAGILLGAAWMARENGYHELEDTYLKEALNQYISAYNNDFNSIGNLNDLQAAYLIGELYRRTGNCKKSVEWFNIVIYNHNITSFPDIEKLAREQWATAREEARNNIMKPEEVVATEENYVSQEKPRVETVQLEPEHTAHKKLTMQMSANLYENQVKWLSQIANNGYNHTRELVTREQVLRALLDAVIEVLDTDLPEKFSGEDELKTIFTSLLSKTKQ
ncbi:MAG: DUF2225 domain-containing protein [Syntrophomonadaceae bacterium]|nr:DUF2225 domain-containing protein [Syntrophomonadaceae bacterium]MDD4549450.1 DUF2225 domain-containing protein [Syntrophomonadaceae bacterium]